jgi:hypothetical protein
MKEVANGKLAFRVGANQRSPVVGSDDAKFILGIG